jgi:hypothetical protein
MRPQRQFWSIFIGETLKLLQNALPKLGYVYAADCGTVTFPASVPSWRVYKVGSGYRPNTSDQVGLILPAKYGGLTYPIVENRGNVVVLDTQAFGRVAAWIAGTEAIIR